MSYPGNSSLAPDVQVRISRTFQQTLDLVTEQKEQEALVGCEFILRMDAEFQPAKTLVARLESGARPVAVEDLRSDPTGGAARPVDDLDTMNDLDDLDTLDDLEDLGDLGFEDDFQSAPEAGPPPGPIGARPPSGVVASGLGPVLQDLLAKRNFRQILQIAESQSQAIENDPEVRAMVDQAQSLLESEAYVQTFLKSAAEARAAGQPQEMERHLDKARSLDPEHPQVLGFAATEPLGDDLPALGDNDLSLAFDERPPAVSIVADSDLAELQAKSLSLDVEEGTAGAEGEVASRLSRDPRQTKPMAAVPLDESLPEAAPVDELFDDESMAGEPMVAEELTFDEAEELPAEEFTAREVAEDLGEGENRVDKLLQEGQDAYDRGEYQAAIDVWSRIFLIDIDNHEASKRIEGARSRKAELERQAEETFHDAVSHLESDSIDEAKRLLRQVLEVQPNHSLAREYLDQMESGQVPTTVSSADLDSGVGAEASLDDLATGLGAMDSPSLEAAVQRDRVVVVKKTDMKMVLVGALVLLAALGIAGLLMLNWDVLFPNQEPPPTVAQQTPKVDPIERATKMHESGNTENAIILLERIQPEDPVYEDARGLIAQWKALVEASPEPVEAGPSEEQIERHAMLLDAARGAHGQGSYLRSRKYYELASKILPLAAEDLARRSEGDEKLEPLRDQIALFDEGQYTAVIPVLWRMHDSDPSNRDVERLLVDSYYNLALTDLQRGNARGAAKKIQEALEVQPENEELERLRLFSQTYVQRQQDLLYRIFVKYLPSR